MKLDWNMQIDTNETLCDVYFNLSSIFILIYMYAATCIHLNRNFLFYMQKYFFVVCNIFNIREIL